VTDLRLLVTEGLLERPVAMKLLSSLGCSAQYLYWVPKPGEKAFWRDAWRNNRAALHLGPVLGLADLETYPCPSGLISQHLREGRNAGFVLRVAERMLESWLIADSEALAAFLQVSPQLVPLDPEGLSHAKGPLRNNVYKRA